MEKTKEVKEEKQKPEKAKMKLWKKILIILGIIVLIFIIDTTRKFVIIRRIQKQYEIDSKNTNYYSEYMNLSDGSFSQVWLYENKYLYKRSSYDENGLTERMIYQDKDKKEQWILVNSNNEKVAVKLEYDEESLIMIGSAASSGLPSINDPLHVQLLCSIWAKITNEKWAKTNCYKIKFNDEYKIWINKDNMRVIAELNGNGNLNGESVPYIIMHKVKYNEIKAEDLVFPDLTEYLKKDSKGNIIE